MILRASTSPSIPLYQPSPGPTRVEEQTRVEEKTRIEEDMRTRIGVRMRISIEEGHLLHSDVLVRDRIRPNQNLHAVKYKENRD